MMIRKPKLKIRTIVGILLLLTFIPMLLFRALNPSATQAATWHFDEGYGTTTTDSASTALPATITGPLWRTEDFCFSGKCLFYDGADDYVSTTSTTVFDAGAAYTAMAWIRPTFGGEAATETFMSKTGVVDFNISDTNDNVVVTYTGGTTASSNTNTIVANKWNHIAVTHNGSGTFVIYVNGVDQTSDASATDTNAAGSVLFGSELTAASTQSYQGFIDLAKIYSSQLTAAQIKAEYTSVAIDEPVSGAIGGTSGQKFLSDGLVGYWKMDENTGTTINDSAGNSLNSSSWTSDPAWIMGKYGSGLSLDGTDYATVSDNNALHVNSHTISAWVNTTTNSGFQGIVGRANGAGRNYALWNTADGDILYEITGSGTCNIYKNAGPGDAANIAAGSGWHLVTGTYDGTTGKLFIDGQLVFSAACTQTLGTSSGDFTIGSYAGLGYIGSLDEVRVYNRALSAKEVTSLYTFAPGPIGHWKLDENTSTAANDSSGNDNTGTLTNTPTWTTGRYGAAVNFAGSDQHITRADDADFDFADDADMTITAFFKHTTAAAQEIILSKFNEAGYKIIMESDGDITCGLDYDATWSPTDSATSTAATYDDDQWHHIACVKSGAASLSLYIDGVLIATDASLTADNTLTNSDPLYIGIDVDGTSNDFVGSIDEVKMYTYARNSSQIIQDLNAGHPLGGSPIGSALGYWRFDEGAENTCSGGANDVCNGGNQGTALDGTSTATRSNSGKVERALDFDGTDDVVTITNVGAIDLDVGLTNGFTWSAWVNPDGAGEGSTGQIFNKGTSTYCQLSSTTPFTLTCNLDYATVDANVAVTSALPVSTWTHVALTFNSTANTISLWINGRLRSTSAAGTGGKAADTANFLIGGGTSNNFDGKIDEVKIYGAELTAAEMAVEYNFGAAFNVGTGSATTEASQLADGAGVAPVGYWNFDDNTGTAPVDRSGNGNNGAFGGAPIWINGKVGQALSFDGVDDYVTIADPASGVLDFGTGSFTVGGWFYLPSENFGARLVNKGASSFNNGYDLETESDFGLTPIFVYGANGVQADSVLMLGTTEFTIPGWNHYMVVVDQTNNLIRMYLDGVAIPFTLFAGTCGTITGNALDISACNNLNGSSADALDIGAYSPGGPSNEFSGYIDEVKIYNYARTTAQVAYDYNRGKPFGWYKLDECTGSTANDNSGKANNGSITIGAGGSEDTVGNCSTASTAWGNGATGKYNGSLDFDGTDDLITVTNADQIDLDIGLTQGFTFATWVYPNSDGETDVGEIFDKGTNTYCRTDNESASRVDIECQVDLTTDAAFNVSSAIPINQWSHVAFSWTNDADDEVTIWINGVPNTSTTTFSGDPAADANNLTIGGTPNFDGQIDDFRIYPYELSAAQIKLLMNNDAPARFGPLTGSP